MFGLVLKSTHDELLKTTMKAVQSSDRFFMDWSEAEVKIIHLNAKIAGYEKTYKIRTGYWLDTSGRWRDPKTGHCVKASVVTTAKLKKERAMADKYAKATAAYAGVNKGSK